MPIARFQMEDGRIARFEVPEGTTPEQAQQMMQAHFSQPQPVEQPEPRSISDELARQAGLTGRAVVEGVGGLADIVGAPIASMTGLRKPSQIASEFGTSIGLPQPETGTERFVGQAGQALVGAGGIVKGGQALAKMGGNTGRFGEMLATQPASQGAAALGSVAGAELGKEAGLTGYGALVPAVLGAATAQGLLSGGQRLGQAAKAIGTDDYVVPPSMTEKPTALARGMETLSGKAKTEQLASSKNQAITNKRVLKDLGMPENTQLSPEMLQSYRNAVFNEGYAPIAKLGQVTPDAKLQGDLLAIVKPHRKQLQDFPDSPVAKSVYAEVRNLFDAAQKPFNADTALAKIKELRELATKAYKGDETSLGKAYKDMANSLEDQIGRQLERSGAGPDALKAFRTARQNIAKSHTVEESMVGSAETGYNINARKLAQLKRGGTPLTGGMERAAGFAESYPKSMTVPVAGATNPYTTTDLFTGGVSGMGGAGLAAMLGLDPVTGALIGVGGNVLRPVARELVLSQPFQRALMQQGEVNSLSRLLQPAMAVQ